MGSKKHLESMITSMGILFFPGDGGEGFNGRWLEWLRLMEEINNLTCRGSAEDIWKFVLII